MVSAQEFKSAAHAFADKLMFGRVAYLLYQRRRGMVLAAHESRNRVPEAAAHLAYIKTRPEMSPKSQIEYLKLKIEGLERSVRYGDDEIERLEAELAAATQDDLPF